MAATWGVMAAQVITPQCWAKRVKSNSQYVARVWLQENKKNKTKAIWKEVLEIKYANMNNSVDAYKRYLSFVKVLQSSLNRLEPFGILWKDVVVFPNCGREPLDRLLTSTDDRNTVPKRDWTQLPNHRGHLTHAQWTCQTGFQYGRHPETPAHSWHNRDALQPRGPG